MARERNEKAKRFYARVLMMRTSQEECTYPRYIPHFFCLPRACGRNDELRHPLMVQITCGRASEWCDTERQVSIRNIFYLEGAADADDDLVLIIVLLTYSMGGKCNKI